MQQMEESINERDERLCIEAFLNWHNKRFKTSFNYERAESVFNEIKDTTRWEFVIKQDQHSSWNAVEIKRLIDPEVRIKLVEWNKFLSAIRNKLGNQLQGEFLIYGVPSLKLDKQKKTELKRLLITLILQNSQSLEEDEMVELGNHIIKQFTEWPSTPHLKPNPPYEIKYLANEDSCFTLHKISDVGCCLELGFAQGRVFIVNQLVSGALMSLFQNGELFKANEQLTLAKQRGANKSILVLDYHLPSWYPNSVKEVLQNIVGPQLSSIDVIYLVKAAQNRVSKVWEADTN